MHYQLILIVAFACVSLIIYCVGQLVTEWFLSYGRSVRDRFSSMVANEHDVQSISLFKNSTTLGDDGTERSTWRDELQHLIDQAGLGYSPEAILLASIAAGAGLGLVTGLQNWVLGIMVFPVGFVAPFLGLFLYRSRRRDRLCRQLPEAFEMISRAVKAGQTVPAAMQIIASEFQAPIADEFALCYDQQKLGISRESALRQLAARSGILELRMFVVAINMQARSGGSLTELLENLAGLIRKRLKLHGRIRALTGEGRMQAGVLIVLPFAAFLGIHLLAPDYANTLTERPWILGVTLVAQLIGACWIRRIIGINY